MQGINVGHVVGASAHHLRGKFSGGLRYSQAIGQLPVVLLVLALLFASASAVAQTSVSNTATIAPPSGVTDPVAGNNSATDTDTVTRASATFRLVKVWANAKLNDAATLSTTGATNNATLAAVANTANETDTGANVTVFSGETLTLAENFTTGLAANYNAVLACTGATDANPADGLTITAADNGAAIVCTYTNTRKSATLTLAKTWVNAIINNVVGIPATTGFTNNTAGLASVANTANETDSGAAVTVFAGDVGTLGAESFTVGTAANYNLTLACSGTTGLAGNTLTVGPADTAITCTYTNTRRSATLTLVKTWANARNGETATVTSTGFTNNASSGLSTSTGNNTTTGTSVTVFAGEAGTIGETLTNAANYNATLACTGTTGLVGNTLTIGAADTAITCTQTNTRKTATVVLAKSWVNAAINDAVTVSATGLTSLNSTATTPNLSESRLPQTVNVGDVLTLSEAFTTGSPANYTTTLACTGTSGLSGSTLTVGSADTAITCTYTNTRKSATLTLAKAWVNGRTGETATVTSTGFGNNASSGLSTSTGNNSTIGTSVTVFAGESGTISETLTNAANYTATLACTGTTGLVGNTLTIGAADTAITCTQTNTRKTATVVLAKTWSNALINDTVTVSATGLTSLNSTATTPNLSESRAPQIVNVGDVLVLTENFTVGAAANYNATLACTGTSGLSGNTLTIGSADTAITCTFTNTRKTATVVLAKTWANAKLNDAVTVSATGLTSLNSVATTPNLSESRLPQTVLVGDVLTLAETFTTGSAANYTTTLACTGTSGLSGSTLTIGSADTAITCTYTNARKSATLTLAKTWVNGLNGETATVTSTGFTNNASSGLSTSTGNNTTTGTSVTVFAGEAGSISEIVSNAGNYNSSLACSGTTGLSGNTLTVGAADTAIVCTFTNSRTSLTLVKTVTNDNGGTATTAAFTLSAAGPTNITGTSGSPAVTNAPVAPGTYTLSESALTGYAAGAWNCVGGTLTGNSLVLAGGQSATCTINNNDVAPILTLAKTIAGRAVVTDQFQLNINNGGPTVTSTGAQAAISTTPFNATAGTAYSLTETYTGTPPADSAYYFETYSCTNATSGGTVVAPGTGTSIAVTPAVGDNITCTFVNTPVPSTAITSKSANPANGSTVAIGSTIAYSLSTLIGNSPNQAPIVLTDTLGAGLTVGTLPAGCSAAGQVITCTIPAGTVPGTTTFNYSATVAVGAVASVGNNVTASTGLCATCTTTHVVANPSLTIDKADGTPTGIIVGSTIPYTFLVTNTGNVTLTGIVINDVNLDAAASCPVTTLAPGANTTCTGTHTLDQADVDAGVVNNAATATGTPPVGPDVTSPVDTTTKAIAQTPALTVDKTASTATYNTVGQVVNYSYLVTNTGNVSISGITVTDDRIPSVSCPVTTLAFAASTTCTGSYTITQADLNAGSVTNLATVNGTPTGGTLTPPTDTVTITAVQAPALTVDKSAPVNADNDASGSITINDVLTYTVAATNTGNVTLTNVAVTDPQLTPASQTCATLAPAATCTLVGTHTVTLSEVNAGQIVNTATGDSDQTAAVTDTVTTLVVPTIDAVADDFSATPINGGNGGTTASIITNDTTNGVAAVIGTNVTLTPGASPNAGLLMNADGTITVAAGTAAGTYVYPYSICTLPATTPTATCDTANATVVVTAATIDAVADASSTPANTAVITDVLANDTNVGGTINPAAVTVTVPSANGTTSVNPATGAITFTPTSGFAGTTTYTYQVCLAAPNAAICDTAIVTVTVNATIDAINDDFSATPINGGNGGTTASIITNDTTNGVAANIGTNVTLTPGASPNAGLAMNADGTITVAAGTAAGTYVYPYSICTLPATTPTATCDTANATVVVTAATIDAVADASSTPANTAVITDVLVNDTNNGGTINPASVTVTVPSANGTTSVNPATGAITFTPTAGFSGTTTYTYQVCLAAPNAAICDTAIVTVTVNATIDAINDDFSATPINGGNGGTTASIITNDTTNGVAANIGTNVTLTPGASPNAGLTMNADGTITVAAGTAAGTYVYPYSICTLPATTPTATCDTANATVVVTAATIDAVADTSSTPANTAVITDVLANDTNNGGTINPASVTVTVPSANGTTSVNPATGAITFTPAAGFAGTTTYTYQVCLAAPNAAICDTAIVTVTVAATIDAVADDFSATPINGGNGGTTASIITNDTTNGVAAVIGTNVTLTPGASPNAGLLMNADGTITVAAGTAAGTYVYPYSICTLPATTPTATCDTANATVVVTAATIDAVADTSSTPANTAVITDVLTNDTNVGGTINPASVTVTVPSANGTTSVNPATGAITFTPTAGFAGTTTYTYQVCLAAPNAAICDTAIVTVTVNATIDAINDDFSATPINGGNGGTTASIITNDTTNGVAANIGTNVTLTPGASPNAGLLMNADGTITVSAGTAAGTYVYPYSICTLPATTPTATCDTANATVVVTAATIDAVADTSSTPANTAVITDVLANDTNVGGTINPASVTVTVPSANGTTSVNPATGAITFTPTAGFAGTTTYTYQVCLAAPSAAICDTAIVTVTVAATIDAVADDFSATPINGGNGGTTASIITNDTTNGVAAVIGTNVTLTPGASPNAGLLMNADGTITVAAGTAAGTYVYPYSICTLPATTPTATCDTANATVVVTAATIDAVADTSSTPANTAVITDVLANDTNNGGTINPASVTVTVPSANGTTSVNPATGAITFTPTAGFSGTTTYTYQVCLAAPNAAICDTAIVTVTVAATIDAVNDATATFPATGGTVPNVTSNDTSNGAAAIIGTNITAPTISNNGGLAGLVANPDGTLTVPNGTPPASYTVTYEICTLPATTPTATCDTAAVTIVVGAPVIDAVNDGTTNLPATGGSVPTVVVNDTVDGAPAVIGTNISVPTISNNGGLSGLTVNADGSLTVPAGNAPGSYTVTYQICSTVVTASCDSATVGVTIGAPVIDAVNDPTTALPATGGLVPTVVANDTVDSAAAVIGTNISVPTITNNGGLTGLIVNGDGSLTVPAGNAPGSYTVTYQICSITVPSSCDTATVGVTLAVSAIVATPDAGTVADGGAGGIAVANVLVNDTLNGAPATLATVVITPISSTSPNITINPATGAVSAAPGTAAGSYTLVYQICEIANPGNCTTTTVTVDVTTGDLAPVAVDDAFSGPENALITGNVAGNDTPGNGASTFTLVAGSGPANGTLVLNPDGSFSYTPNAGFVGVDTFVYQACDGDGDCDTATVTLTINPIIDKLRILKSVGPSRVSPGMLVSYTLVVSNVGTVPVTGAQVVDTPPAGFGFVAGSEQIVDTDNAGTTSGTGPITFSGIDVPVGGTATIRYLLRVSAGLPAGEYTNRATVFQGGVAVSNTAAASVIADAGMDPTTEQSRILGKVFDDQDGDGWQDEGERGIPGVRLATVEGLVTETDSQGRYHLEGLTLSNMQRGQNFVVKVDASTLPAGSVFTTENPLLRRVTPAIPVRFDFGVKLPQRPKQAPVAPTETVVPAKTLTLGQVMFDTDKDTVKPAFAGDIAKIAEAIEAAKGGVIRITGYADLRGSAEYNQALSMRRARAVYEQVAARLSPEARAGLQVEVEGAVDVPGDKK